jgi:hypothetical protein
MDVLIDELFQRNKLKDWFNMGLSFCIINQNKCNFYSTKYSLNSIILRLVEAEFNM